MQCIIVILASLSSAYATKDIYIDVPAHASSGENAELGCGSSSNMVKLHWYKDEQEFFTFRPRQFAPFSSASPIPGFHKVEKVFCDYRVCKIRLIGLTEEGTGLYRCDVERSLPHPYKIATKIDFMNVSAHPNPEVKGLMEDYLEGAVMQASCESKTLKLRWFVNRREIASLRGSQHFVYVSNRHLFHGMPPKIAVKCTEDFHGRTYESEEKTVFWSGFVNDVEVARNCAVCADMYSLIAVCVHIIIVNLVLK